MLNKFLNILFPEKCPICTSPSNDHKTAPICSVCWQSLSPYTGPKCNKCSRPLVSDLSITCGDCISDGPLYLNASSFGLYNGALKKAINLLKYHGLKRLSKPLADLLLRLRLPEVDAVIPVPLYEARLRKREFNQSALIANNVAKSFGKGLVLDCLTKTRDTPPQVGLSSKERTKNIRNAFEVQNQSLIQGKKILLIDDVFTTGATVRECSRVLIKAGAGDIYVLTLAHGIQD